MGGGSFWSFPHLRLSRSYWGRRAVVFTPSLFPFRSWITAPVGPLHFFQASVKNIVHILAFSSCRFLQFCNSFYVSLSSSATLRDLSLKISAVFSLGCCSCKHSLLLPFLSSSHCQCCPYNLLGPLGGPSGAFHLHGTECWRPTNVTPTQVRVNQLPRMFLLCVKGL